MKVLKVIGILLLVVVALGLIGSLVLPKEINVTVEETIEAPIDVVYANISSYEKADNWSPWYDDDEDMKVNFEGESGAVGSSFTWSGNKNVGTGTQTITAVDVENHRIESKVTHSYGEGTGSWSLEDMGDGTVKATWDYHEETGIPGNLFSALMDAEGMMTNKFTKGLANLKVIAEEEANNVPEEKPVYEVQEIDRAATKYAGNKEIVKMADMHTYFMENMPKIGEAAKDMAAGAPSALYWDWDTVNHQSEMTVAMPISGDVAPDGYEVYEQPEGKYLLVDYYGDYSQSEAAHGTIGAYMGANGLRMNGAVMEEYLTDPGVEMDTTKWHTRIYYPVAAAEVESSED